MTDVWNPQIELEVVKHVTFNNDLLHEDYNVVNYNVNLSIQIDSKLL